MRPVRWRLTLRDCGPLLLLAASACAIDEEQFTIAVCDASERFDVVHLARPAMNVDYLDLREIDWHENPAIVDAVGARCDNAEDVDACWADVDALPTESEFVIQTFSDVCCQRRLVTYTRGDEVGAIGTGAELDAFLGTIDTAGDAALVVLLKHPRHHIRCDAPAQVAPHPEGHLVFTRTGSGCGAGSHVRHNVVLVREDGAIEILESDIVDRGQWGCSIP